MHIIEVMLSWLRAKLVTMLDNKRWFWKLNRHTMISILEEEISYWRSANDDSHVWFIAMRFISDRAREFHLTAEGESWLGGAVWSALNRHNGKHMHPFTEEFINYNEISREEMIYVLTNAIALINEQK